MDRQARESEGSPSADAPNAAGRRYRSLAASLGDGLFQLDEDDRFVDADDGFADLTGRRREDLLETHVSDVLVDGETGRLQTAIDAAREGADAETVSLAIRQNDGSRQSVEVTIDVADGQSRSVVGTVERADGTGAASAAHGHPDWQVSTLVENVPGMVYRCRNERGWPMEFVSDAFAELTGYDPEAIERDEISWGEDIMVDDARENLWEAVQEAVAEDETFSETYRIETAGGRTRWVRDYGRAVPVDDGDDVAIEGIIADVTKRKRLEAELEEVFGRVTDAFFALDEDWRFTYLNERAHELINPEGRQLEGKNVGEEFPDAISRKFKDKYERAMDEQEVVSFEEYYPDPLDAWFEVHAYPSATGLSVYFRDVTDRKKREQELEQYETIVETIPDGTYVLDEDHRFVALDGTFAEMTGYDREELLGRDAEIVSTDHGHERGMELRGQLREGEIEVAKLEEKIKSSDGEAFDAEIRFSALWDDDGTFRGTAGALRDITERKEREREHELFRNLLDRSSDAVLVSDPETAQILDVNDTAAHRLGYEREELLELTIPDIETEMNSQADWDSFIDDLRAEGQATFHGSHERQDGSTFPVEVKVSYVQLDREYVLSVARDVTERMEYERELQRKERRYEAVFEDPNILVGLLEPDGTVLDINRTAMEYIDADLDAVTGKPFWETPWWGDDEVVDDVREWVERAADGEYVDFEADLARPGGEQYTIEGYFRPVTNDDGEVVSIIVSDRDVTERKERERELEQYQSLTEAASDVIVTIDEESIVRSINPAVEEIFGYDQHELVDEPLTKLMSDDLAEQHRAALSRYLDIGEKTLNWDYIEMQGQRSDGTEIPISITFSEATYEGERYFTGVIRDIRERKERERRLEESERRYRTLVENFPNGAVALVDEDLRYRTVGGNPEKTAGVSAEEIEGSKIRDVIPPELADELVPRYEAALDGEPSLFELERDGHFFRFQILPIRDDDGEVFAALGMSQDITERRLHERKIEESERRYRALAEHFPNGIVTLFDHDYEYTLAAGRGFDTIGVDPADLEGRTFDEVWDGATAETLRPALEGALDGEERSVDLEYEGREWVVHAAPVTDEDGEVFAGMTMAQDITERRAYQRRLEESEQRYRALAENFPNGGVGVFDEDLRYTLVTGTMWDDIPPDAGDLEGESIREALPPETAADVEPIFRGALEGETESVVSQLGGRTYRVWATPLRDASGEITAGQSIAVDITDQLQREAELEASNERLEQFAYAASHDLQEPLRMVSSYLSLIERRYGEDLPEDAVEFLEYAVDGAERMRKMIDALLEYSRIETQGRPFEAVDLEAVLEDARRDLRMRIEETDAEITIGSLPEIEGDEDQLRQVFQNLLDNAIEYSGDGRPRIDIDAERDDDEWVVSIRDEGIGIEAKHTDGVFEVFQRLHTQDEHSGTGIGLALCRRIVERHDGDIWAESSGEDGTTFYFTLPVSGGEQ